MWVATPDSCCGGFAPAAGAGALPPSAPVLALDLDHTVIRPTKGRRRPKDLADWEWNLAPAALKAWAGTHRLVLFTNQAGLKTPAEVADFLRGKIGPVLTALKAEGVVAGAFVAAGQSKYRKPKTAMWDFFVAPVAGPPGRVALRPDKSRSLYVGDAAGRPGDYGAGSDRKFAENLGIAFATPEQLAAIPPGTIPPPALPPLPDAPYQWLDPGAAPPLPPGVIATPGPFVFSAAPEVVLMCGSPGGGKSSWCRARAAGEAGKPPRTVVSLDAVGSRPKCMRLLREAVARGGTVLVDETNRSKAMRGHYLKVGRELGVPVRCVYLPTPRALAVHLDALRLDHPVAAHSKPKRLHAAAINSYFKNHQVPDITEGFAQIHVEPFVFDPALTPQDHFFRWHA